MQSRLAEWARRLPLERGWRAAYVYEPEVALAMRAHLRTGDTFIDVGANYGLLSLYASHRVGPQGRVEAFEPHPGMAAHLRRLLGRRKNASVHESVVLDREAEAVGFHLDLRTPIGSASSLLRLDGLGPEDTETIARQATTLDRFFGESLAPAFIKIDCEGADIEVIRGARQVIERARPVLVFELWKGWWPAFRETFAWLESLDYSLTRTSDGADLSAGYYDDPNHEELDTNVLCVFRR